VLAGASGIVTGSADRGGAVQPINLFIPTITPRSARISPRLAPA
jgi:hypothetical protein